MDKGHICASAFLNMSSAFDTVDHEILLHRLKISFGVTSKVLDWIKSYLSGRTQSVVLTRSTTTSKVILYGSTRDVVKTSSCKTKTTTIETKTPTIETKPRPSNGSTPYPGHSGPQVLEYVQKGNHMVKPIVCPNALYSLMISSWKFSPTERPSFPVLKEKLGLVVEESCGNCIYADQMCENIFDILHNQPGEIC